MTLSPSQRAAVLDALLAEAARLRAASLCRLRRRAAWIRLCAWLGSSLSSPPVLIAVLTLALCVLIGAVYLCFSGTAIPLRAHLSGRGALGEHRYGPLNLQWTIRQPVGDWRSRALHAGDEIIALTPITITHLDGAAIYAAPGARLRMLPDGSGVTLLHGEIVGEAATLDRTSPALRVETTAGTITARHARFRVQSRRSGAVYAFADEGRVRVANDVGAIDLVAGEQVGLKATMLPKAELQVPRIVFDGHPEAADRVASNSTRITFRTRVLPRATLIAERADSGQQFARYVADAGGQITGALPEIADRITLRFSQADAEGQVSASSPPIEIVIDRTPPMLAVEPVELMGDEVIITGRTEVSAKIRINGIAVPPRPDGFFSLRLAATHTAATRTDRITITAVDDAGNATTIVQSLRKQS